MILSIPFIPQEDFMACGPAALRMVIAYYSSDPGVKCVEEFTGRTPGKAIATLQICLGAIRFGHKASFYITSLSFDRNNSDLEFYKKHVEVIEQQNKFLVEAQAEGAELYEEFISSKSIIEKLSDDCVPIVLLDWHVVKGVRDRGFRGHAVPVVGFEDGNVIVHDPGTQGPTPYVKIPFEVFDAARRARGTDGDVCFVYREKL